MEIPINYPMLQDDNSKEISIRKVELVTLNEKSIIFHLKYSGEKQTKTYASIEEAKSEFEKISRRIENYFIVKSGKPLNSL
ncbi:MAG: hypothetical protein JSS63_04445 [Bacteroidetes bacterium]|nr:hypothetical protein [Bacteroidota bacterium]MBX7045478.1 hypothetical protein [Ignavibacteria bacterium]